MSQFSRMVPAYEHNCHVMRLDKQGLRSLSQESKLTCKEMRQKDPLFYNA